MVKIFVKKNAQIVHAIMSYFKYNSKIISFVFPNTRRNKIMINYYDKS